MAVLIQKQTFLTSFSPCIFTITCRWPQKGTQGMFRKWTMENNGEFFSSLEGWHGMQRGPLLQRGGKRWEGNPNNLSSFGVVKTGFTHWPIISASFFKPTTRLGFVTLVRFCCTITLSFLVYVQEDEMHRQNALRLISVVGYSLSLFSLTMATLLMAVLRWVCWGWEVFWRSRGQKSMWTQSATSCLWELVKNSVEVYEKKQWL